MARIKSIKTPRSTVEARKTGNGKPKRGAKAREVAPAGPNSINGKLGKVAVAVTGPTGASLAELKKVTGWQSHSIRAALSGLRKRGFDISIQASDDRKAYIGRRNL